MTKEDISPYSVKALRLTVENNREESKQYLKDFKKEFKILMNKIAPLQRDTNALLHHIREGQAIEKREPLRAKHYQIEVEEFNNGILNPDKDIFTPLRDLYDQDERWHFSEVYMFNYLNGSWITIHNFLITIDDAIDACRKVPTYFNEKGIKIYRPEPLSLQLNIIFEATCSITLAINVFLGTAKEALNKIHLLELLFDIEERQK